MFWGRRLFLTGGPPFCIMLPLPATPLDDAHQGGCFHFLLPPVLLRGTEQEMAKKRLLFPGFKSPPPTNWALHFGRRTLPALQPAPGRLVATILSDTGGKSPADTPYFDPDFDPNYDPNGPVGPAGTTAFDEGFSLGFQ